MNTLERRQIVRGQVIDVSVAKAAVNKSRRERAEAAKKLRKAMAASRFAMRSSPIRFPIRDTRSADLTAASRQIRCFVFGPARDTSIRASMKVRELRVGHPVRVVFDPLGDDVNHAFLTLQLSAHDHQIRLQDLVSIGLEHPRPEDDVVDAGFVFERSEDHAVRGLRMLQMSDQSADAHPGAASSEPRSRRLDYAHSIAIWRAAAPADVGRC